MDDLHLGVLLNAEYAAGDLVTLGEFAEQLGYAHFFYVDVRFSRECYIGLASVAMRTQRLLLGTGVTDPYSRHPAITATSIATLDELSAGRAVLGFGLGGAGFRELGIQKKLPVAALRESIAMMRQLWRGEAVTLDGKVVSVANGRLDFAPRRSAIPIYIATQGEQISRLAGELADGVLIANTATEQGLDFYLRCIAEGAAKGARNLRNVDINLRWEICISSDEAAAVQVMRRRLAQRLINGYPNWGFLNRLGVNVTPEFETLAAQHDRALLDQAVAALPMDVVDANMLAGNAERVASRIAPLLRPEVTGVTIRPHACPGTSVAEVMRSFVEDVMPLVGKRQVASRST